jgi:DNA-binding IclR family transcriptional regulator
MRRPRTHEPLSQDAPAPCAARPERLFVQGAFTPLDRARLGAMDAPSPPTRRPRSGANNDSTIGRAAHLLRMLAVAGGHGLGLSELSTYVGLPHPTVHRLLGQLIDEGLARRVETSRRYILGPMLFELGLAAAPHFEIRPHCKPYLMQLAESTGETVYLTIRSGDEAVCIDCCNSATADSRVLLVMGTRWPLGAGSGSVAMLARMPREERDHIVSLSLPRLRGPYNVGKEDFITAIEEASRTGYAFLRNRVALGDSAVAVALTADGRPVGSVTVVGPNHRIPHARAPEIARQLQQVVGQMELRLAPYFASLASECDALSAAGFAKARRPV